MSIYNNILHGGMALLLAGGMYTELTIAEENIPRGPIPFEAYDLDGNYKISMEEFNSVRAERRAAFKAEGRPMAGAKNAPSFAEIDSNGDGQLTKTELMAEYQTRMAKRWEMKMGQGSGNTQGKNMRRNRPSFSDVDVNADGKITAEEFENFQGAFYR